MMFRINCSFSQDSQLIFGERMVWETGEERDPNSEWLTASCLFINLS